jgi:putative ABC transport system permease protein
MLDALARDVVYGLRIARRNPGFTTAAVLTLGLGIGVTTTTFTVADAILFRPLPYAQPERLVKIWGRSSAHPTDNMALADFSGVSHLTAIFEQVGADDGTGVRVEDGQAWHAANVALVTPDWLATLGVRPALGRGFLAEEFLVGRDNVGVLTHVYWQRRFGGDPAVIGRVLRIDGRALTIVGVLPPNVLRYGSDLLLPLVVATYPPSREYRNLDVVARLRPGATIASARAALGVLARQLDAVQSSPYVNREFSVAPLGKNYASIGPGAGHGMMLLLGAVALVLLIACVNVASLLLARSIPRERECAVRSALGASRMRLTRQLLVENMLLFVAGGGLGCFLAWWSLDVLTALGVSGGYVPERLVVALDARVLAFSTLVTMLTAVTFGLGPALRGGRVSVTQGLKDASQSERGGSSRLRTRRVLIVAELALSVVLLVGCGLIVRSLAGLYANVDGFVPDRLLETGSDAGREFAPALTKWRAALERARRITGVESAALSSRPPVHGARLQSFSVSGRPAVDQALEPRAGDILISPDYFKTMGIPLRRGRAFTELDTHTSTPVVIISETLARQQFPGEDPIGQRIRINERSPMSCCVVAAPVDGVWREIIAVAGDIRQANLDEPPAATIYRPYGQIFEHDMFLLVRARADRDLAPVAAALATGLREVDPSMFWTPVQSMHQSIQESGAVRTRRFVVRMLSGFSLLALALAAVGLYGVMAYLVIERRREIAVRMALGATRSVLFTQILGEAGRLLLIGLVVGAIAARWLTRFIASLLFGVATTDLGTHLAVFVVLGAVGFLASYLPARRAAAVDPMAALRE